MMPQAQQTMFSEVKTLENLLHLCSWVYHKQNIEPAGCHWQDTEEATALKNNK